MGLFAEVGELGADIRKIVVKGEKSLDFTFLKFKISCPFKW